MRPAVVLVATIAVAAVAGTAVSLAQRPPAAAHPPRSTPSGVAATLPNNQPAVAFGFSVASDSATQHLVLFGGVDNFDETWLWDGAAWARAHPPISPSGRYGASAAFDPEIGEVLLFGGTLQMGQATNDTWGWDGRTWQRLDGGTDGPAGGGGSDMAWDSTLSEMVLVTPSAARGGGGETWVWSGARWVRDVAGSIGASDTGILIAFDPLSSSLLAEGCCTSKVSGGLSTQPSTWRWNGSEWIALTTSMHPLDGSSMQEDPSLRRLVLCSCDLAGGLSPEMWVWNGRDWTKGPYPQAPVAPEAEAIDPADSQFLILGSAIAGADALTQTVQVWAMRGAHWLRLGVGLASG
jgi:hypothetical protein